jgi:hypothetical protein
MNYLKTFLPYLFGNKEGKSYVLPDTLEWENLKFEELLMFHTLKNTLDQFSQSLSLSDLSNSQIFHLFSYARFLPHDFFYELKNKYTKEFDLFLTAKAGDVLNASEVQDILNYKNYELSVFAIFGKDRKRPGKIFIKNSDGRFVHAENQSVWSIPVLGLSGRGLPFNHSNGTTPCGVFTIDSVMPVADQHYEFGKHRRLKVNFLPKTPNEENIKQFLPRTHHKRTWWSQCIVGRELGRSLLRIHGTGRVNKNPFSSYYPMIPSSGCLTTTERDFMGLVRFNHQRDLLDTLMEAQGLEKIHENESKIHGVLYVIEFDDTYQALEFKS